MSALVSARVHRAAARAGPAAAPASRARRALGASNQVIQAKLRVGPVDDPLEREADRAADAVLAGGSVAPLDDAPTLPQRKCAASAAIEEQTVRRKCAECEGEEDETVRRAADRASAPPSDAGADAAAAAVAGGGAPLSPDVRAYFEPRFGQDFSAVRVHTDARAQSAAGAIDARAYTLGRNIAFAPGEFSPSTQAGRSLLAHELAHVAQQHSPAAVRRKIEVLPDVSIDTYLRNSGVTGFSKDDGKYSHPKGGEKTSEQSVLIPMLSSARVFSIDGTDDATAITNLKAHVTARFGVVSFAAQKKYDFAALAGWKMNDKYWWWNTTTGKFGFKEGVDRQAARDDVNLNPEMYAIGCAAATVITLKGGGKTSELVDLVSSDESDWVPGEAGYIENTNYAKGGKGIGYMGENIIYTGNGQFWGHFTGLASHTLKEWTKMVENWDGGAKIDSKREMPATGLATGTGSP